MKNQSQNFIADGTSFAADSVRPARTAHEPPRKSPAQRGNEKQTPSSNGFVPEPTQRYEKENSPPCPVGIAGVLTWRLITHTTIDPTPTCA